MIGMKVEHYLDSNFELYSAFLYQYKFENQIYYFCLQYLKIKLWQK
jgi:hypothetical protein